MLREVKEDLPQMVQLQRKALGSVRREVGRSMLYFMAWQWQEPWNVWVDILGWWIRLFGCWGVLVAGCADGDSVLVGLGGELGVEGWAAGLDIDR